ncbi:50S ribosomal protein L10 [Helcococcus bovis]|uniref:50S ribosomal protein L10 n=1 Tax=Helcococcus bovis TaxID=3153252 RepID=UPI0038B7E561
MSQSALSLKQQVVSEIKDAIQNSKSVVVVEYRGLNVEQVSDLRNKYRAEGVSYKVYKNTMVKIALEELGYEGFEEYLAGPNGFVFSNEDMVAGPRITVNFAKENEKLVVKAGLLDGKVVDAEDVKALAKLPTREVLVAQVLGGLNAPIAGFANVLQGTLRQVVYALNAVKEKQEQNA